jgi:hypothetical protein
MAKRLRKKPGAAGTRPRARAVPAERCPRCNGLDRVPIATPKFIMAGWFACPHCNHVWGIPKSEN